MKYFLAYMCHIYVVLDTTLSIGDWTCMYDHYILTCMNSFIVLPKKTHRISHLYQTIRFDQNHKSHKFNRNWRDWSAVSYTIRIEWITISHKHKRNWRNWSGMWYHQTWLQPTYQGLFYETGETGVVYSITRLDYNKNTYNLVETGETEDMWYHLIWLRQKLKYIINWRNWSPTAYN